MCGMKVATPSQPGHALSLAAKVALLRESATYPERPDRIDTIETHMSCVFLTGAHAYKMKKPVRYSYLDFSTLAEREHYCREELRVNQRLASGVYLGVVPLAIDATGSARIEGKGAVVEWLVKMRRLPARRMLPYLLHANAVTEAEIRRVARILVVFYREGGPIVVGSGDFRSRYRRAIVENRAVLSDPRYGLSQPLVADIHVSLDKTIQRMREMFDRRVLEGRIVDGHGDLRPEHVCLEDPPIIFDRLEFNRQFRLIDIAEELGFLALECERLGAPFIGEVLFDEYARMTGDIPPRTLRNFYMAHRACIRARLAVLHTAELERVAWDKWLHTATQYLHLAQAYRPIL